MVIKERDFPQRLVRHSRARGIPCGIRPLRNRPVSAKATGHHSSMSPGACAVGAVGEACVPQVSSRHGPVRVLVYSPTRLFGEGIAAFVGSIESVSAVRVEYELRDLEKSKILEFQASLAIFDVTSPQAIPLARIATLDSEVSTIAMAVPEIAEDVIACADAGFAAYVPRTATVSELAVIIDQVLKGGTVCDPRIARSLFNELARRRPKTENTGCDDYLTRREIKIARLLGRGLSNKEIAHELNLSVATIKNHVHAVLQKLQIDRRTQVTNLLVENPWILRLP